MRNLIGIVAGSLMVILAALPPNDMAWLLTVFGLVAVWLLCRIERQERRAEHKHTRIATLDAIESLYASEQPDRARDDAVQD